MKPNGYSGTLRARVDPARTRSRLVTHVAVAVALSSTVGCATVATIQTVTPTSARLFSGTRLDLLAATGSPIPSRLFKTSPPPYPWLDLPFSFVLDVVILPLTLGVNVSR